MKKIIFLFLSASIAVFILYSNMDKYIKTNKVYTKHIDLNQDSSKITIDNTRIMEKSKQILNYIYDVDDFSQFTIESDFYDNIFYIYFFNKDENGYFISYNIDKGVVITLGKLLDKKKISENEIKSLEEIEEIIEDYLNELELSDSDNYVIIDHAYYSNYLDVKLANQLTQNEIRFTINIYNGELVEYDFFEDTYN